MYAAGQGVSKDYKEAAHWYRLAAEQGHRDAAFNLGGLCAAGRGVPQDYVEAHKWFGIAAAAGDPDSPRAQASIEARMTAEQIQKAKAQAAAWKACASQAECDARVK
jgi:TPR repeat protein